MLKLLSDLHSLMASICHYHIVWFCYQNKVIFEFNQFQKTTKNKTKFFS